MRGSYEVVKDCILTRWFQSLLILIVILCEGSLAVAGKVVRVVVVIASCRNARFRSSYIHAVGTIMISHFGKIRCTENSNNLN